jgi:hypothetical protein
MARGVWYLAHAAAVAAAVVGATNVQVGTLVSMASLEHSNPFQVPPPGTRGTRRQRRYAPAPPVAGWTTPLPSPVDAPSQLHRKGRTKARRVILIVYRCNKHGNHNCITAPPSYWSVDPTRVPGSGVLRTRILICIHYALLEGPFLRPRVLAILREGPCSQGASSVVCGSGEPPYDFLDLYGVFNSKFSIING